MQHQIKQKLITLFAAQCHVNRDTLWDLGRGLTAFFMNDLFRNLGEVEEETCSVVVHQILLSFSSVFTYILGLVSLAFYFLTFTPLWMLLLIPEGRV